MNPDKDPGMYTLQILNLKLHYYNMYLYYISVHCYIIVLSYYCYITNTFRMKYLRNLAIFKWCYYCYDVNLLLNQFCQINNVYKLANGTNTLELHENHNSI